MIVVQIAITYSKKQIMFITIPASSDLESSYYEIDRKKYIGSVDQKLRNLRIHNDKKGIFLTKIGEINLKYKKIKANKNESIRFVLI